MQKNRFNSLQFTVIFSGFIVFLNNVLTLYVVDKVRPLTYNVISQIKMLLTLLLGYLMFNEGLSAVQILGVIVNVFASITLYYFKVIFFWGVYICTTR